MGKLKSISKFKKIIIVVISLLFIIILITQIRNSILSNNRKNLVKNLEVLTLQISYDFRKEGYKYSTLYDGTELPPDLDSDGSSCFDFGINGSSCEPPSTDLTLIGKSDDISEREKIVSILKNNGFQIITDLPSGSFLGDQPNFEDIRDNQPMYELWMMSTTNKDRVYLGVKLKDEKPKDSDIDNDKKTRLQINLFDLVDISERNKKYWRESTLEKKL